MMKIALAAALVACLPVGAWAAGAADKVAVVDPHVRMVPPGAMATAAYLVLKNSGDKDVKLVKAENGASKITELHTHLNEGGMMKMRQVPAIEIRAKGSTTLEPGGLHIMMIDLNGPLKEGDKIAITLGFDDGSSKRIEAPIRRPTPAPAINRPELRH